MKAAELQPGQHIRHPTLDDPVTITRTTQPCGYKQLGLLYVQFRGHGITGGFTTPPDTELEAP